MLKDLVLANRSYRRFKQDEAISIETLKELVDLARCSASATNRQPLKYILSNTPEKNAKIFETVGWAGLLRDWPGPSEGERPSAYIVVLLDTEIAKDAGCDHGIAAQSILLGAAEKGLVVALGKPGEKVVLETLEPGANFAYWRDAQSVHHVPKRKLDDIILG